MTAKARNRLLKAVFGLAVVGAVAALASVYYFNVSASANGDADKAVETSAEADPAAAGQDAEEDTKDAKAEGEENDEAEETAVPVHVVSADTGPVSTYISVTANLIPENEVAILAEAEGRVDRLLVEEGDRVATDQLLAALDRDEALINFNKAEVRAKNGKAAYQRALRMSEEELISNEEFDTTATDHEVAEQELAEARWTLERTEIRSPFQGRVTRRNITEGKHVRKGDELFVVTDFDPLIARVHLPEKDVLALEVGRGVQITLKADEGVRFPGRIRQISPVVDPSTGTVKVTVEAIDPPGIVRPGGFVTIDIVRETREAALVLPRDAVIRELQNAHVFVVEEDIAVKRDVEIGLEERDVLEVVAGVERGERVVVAGQGGLKDGAKIKVLPDDEPADDRTAVNDSKPSRRG